MKDHNMAAVDISDGPTMVWVGQSVLLKDFKHSYTAPNIVKIVQGEYMNLGPKTSTADEKESEVLLHSIQNTSKILAVNMRYRDGRQIEQTEQKLSIPMTYEGWFEVVSEDGRRIRAIEHIKDLAKIFPHTCLVRENIRAYLANENGELCLDKCRVVQAGELLTLFGVISTTINNARGSTEVRFLRCLDQRGASAYFTFEQRGLFSPVAGKGNISGVHTIKGILDKFHLPLTINLVYGPYPKQMPVGKFTGTIRLLYVYQDETAFVCPARGNYRMLPISTEIPLKVLPALNFDELKDNKMVKDVWERCSQMARSYLNTIHVLYDVPVPQPTNKNMSNPFVAIQEGTEKLWEQSSSSKLPQEEEEQLMDEVEDIYLYVVRHGVDPPTMATRTTSTDPADKDYWEEPIYNTLHKKSKNRQSLINVVKRMERTAAPHRSKIFRFHHQDDKVALQGRALAFVRTDKEYVDDVRAIDGTEGGDDSPPPVPPKLFDRAHSMENLLDVNTQEARQRRVSMQQKTRRRSQPAIFRIFKKDKHRDSGKDGGSSGGSAETNSAEEDAKVRRSKIIGKMKQMYL